MHALVIPVEGPVQTVELDGTLGQLQGLVGGRIEAIRLPSFIRGADHATAYIDEEGKFGDAKANMRATDFMVPGVGLFPGDYIAGPFVVCGFDPETGEHAEIPASVTARVRLIEREAGTPAPSTAPVKEQSTGSPSPRVRR